jgi:hypothetical protein
MAMNREAISQQMRTTIPRCIGQFVCAPAERPEPWKADDIAVWRIACKCGGRFGSFLGYPLSRYNTDYSGSEFVGPLGYECAKCGQVTEILDTNQHGYHAEACASSTKICGEGPREAFACPSCAGKNFEVLSSFFFWPASIDLVEDEPDEFESRAQDLFCEFVAHGRCQGCGTVARFTDFGKL